MRNLAVVIIGIFMLLGTYLSSIEMISDETFLITTQIDVIGLLIILNNKEK